MASLYYAVMDGAARVLGLAVLHMCTQACPPGCLPVWLPGCSWRGTSTDLRHVATCCAVIFCSAPVFAACSLMLLVK